MNKLKYPILFLLLVLFLNSSDSLSYKNEILEDPEQYCCNNGICNGDSCSKTSSIKYLNSQGQCIHQVGLTCYDCIQMHAQNRLCQVTITPTYCLLADGTRYYGDENPTNIQN